MLKKIYIYTITLKHYWHVFRYEKLFEKQPLPHCQTPSISILEHYTILDKL
jgi:hypothetical protein